MSIIGKSVVKFEEIIKKYNLLNTEVSVTAKSLTPEEAIGNPERKDYPIIEGKEKIIEAEVLTGKGHAFTDSPKSFTGQLKEVLDIDLISNSNRAIYAATLNAVLQHLGLTSVTVHCKDNEPEKCAVEIADFIKKEFGTVKIGLIGLNPAIAESLLNVFGKENVLISDLNKDNINKIKFGTKILNGKTQTEDLVKKSDFVLITGTTLINNTFDEILRYIEKHQKKYYCYGVTVAGVNSLLGINRICPYGRDK